MQNHADLQIAELSILLCSVYVPMSSYPHAVGEISSGNVDIPSMIELLCMHIPELITVPKPELHQDDSL